MVLAIMVGYVCILSPSSSAATDPAPAAVADPPQNPITQEQMRKFFDVCHIPIVSQKLTHEKMEGQRKQLPAWYPQPVWDDIEIAIDNVDLAAVAFPIYEKYLSAQLAEQLIQFLATAPGQDAVRVVLEKMVQAQHAGASVSESRRIAEEYLQQDRNGAATKILSEMTPAQRKKADSLGSEYRRMQPVFAQINAEYSRALIAKQTELAKAIVQKHQDEIAEARSQYQPATRK